MHNLADEFSRQASMEIELSIPTALMAAPKKDPLTLSKSQLGFMNLFAIPLFEGVADILPTMQYCVDELLANKTLFENRVAEELNKASTVNVLSQQDMIVPVAPPIALEPPAETNAEKQELLTAERSVDVKPPDESITVDQPYNSASTPSQAPQVADTKVDGIATTFDAVADFARSDPFNINDCKTQGPTKQRCSETTEGSSAPYCGDWASQATSATTGKMPLSPSTQGTSIISRDSLDRPNSVPVITAPESTSTVPESTKSQSELKVMSRSADSHHGSVNGNYINGTVKSVEVESDTCKTIKKKPSRFRINALPFFRKHKSTSPSMTSADTAG